MQRMAAKMRTGMAVFIGLTVLSIIEYYVAIEMHSGATIYLVAMALAKAGLILQYFMHVAHLWNQEGHHD